MGSVLSIKLNVSLYKWSSAEFPQEYAIICNHDSHELIKFEGSSVFRVSASPNKVLCRLADCFSNNPVRFHVEVTAETDNSGNRRFGEVKVVSDGTSQAYRLPQNDAAYFPYGGPAEDRLQGYFEVKQEDRTTWEVRLIYVVGFRTQIKSIVKIRCDKVGGLSVELCGPSKYKGLPVFKEELIGPYISREVKGEPSRTVRSLVETEFIGEAFILFPRGTGNTTFPVAVQATGLINNIGAKHDGDYNGSLFYNCRVKPRGKK